MRLFAKLAAVALSAAVATSPAYAVDSYLFGFSPFGTQTLILNGGAFTLTATETGWYFQSGTRDATNQNYIVGDCTSCTSTGAGSYNDYFIFNLASTLPTITSAVLDIGNGNGYVAGPMSTYSLFDVTSPIGTIDVTRATANAVGAAIFTDFESGVLYGTRSITSVVQNSQVQTTLNAAAVASLNAARGQSWAIGGTLRPGNVVPGAAVPEPASWGMLILGFCIVGASLRRRRRSAPTVFA